MGTQPNLYLELPEHTTHSRFAHVMEGSGFVCVEMQLSLEQMRG